MADPTVRAGSPHLRAPARPHVEVLQSVTDRQAQAASAKAASASFLLSGLEGALDEVVPASTAPSAGATAGRLAAKGPKRSGGAATPGAAVTATQRHVASRRGRHQTECVSHSL